MFKLELLSAGAGKGAVDVDAMIKRHQTNMLRAVLADWMMLGTGDTGSWSLSSDRTDQFGVVLGGIMDIICGVMNRQAIPALARLNGWNLDELPTMMHGDVESPDLQKLGEYIAKMVGAGVIVADDELRGVLARGRTSTRQGRYGRGYGRRIAAPSRQPEHARRREARTGRGPDRGRREAR